MTLQPQKRSALVDLLSQSDTYDVLIIGGGIHGATVARLAAQAGLKTALLEKNDYASATSSRSSKMAHGGLRYLELGDFQQVFEGIKSRDKLFREFAHLVRPYPFLIPVPKGNYFFQLKLKCGLFLYDLMARNKALKHSWIPRQDLSFDGFDSSRTDLQGCFQYYDGVLSDCRLVMENLMLARSFGASCLNYAEVLSVSPLKGEQVSISWRDTLSEQSHEVQARSVINCAGPWAPFIDNPALQKAGPKARYSQGTHLLFDRPWTGPALFLPMAGKARYYFVWPHFAGTMVGTTEREVAELVSDPVPAKDEIEEVLKRIERDLPCSGLNRDSLHYAFAGVRTLPVKGSSLETGRLSRKHIWFHQEGMLTLLGGKLTTAEWTAWEGVKKLGAQLGHSFPKQAPSLPQPDLTLESFSEAAKECGLARTQTERLWRRYGIFAKEVLSDCTALGDYGVQGELDYALRYEQAECVEDLLRRRLELEYEPGAALDILPEVASSLKKHTLQDKPDELNSQLEEYKNRHAQLASLLAK